MKDAALIISTGATAMLFAVAEAVTERAARNKEKRIFTVCNNESSRILMKILAGFAHGKKLKHARWLGYSNPELIECAQCEKKQIFIVLLSTNSTMHTILSSLLCYKHSRAAGTSISIFLNAHQDSKYRVTLLSHQNESSGTSLVAPRSFSLERLLRRGT